ncbi:MAG TPA: LptF/LptG family permease [Candidatus Baltobacteraceae bacterium]
MATVSGARPLPQFRALSLRLPILDRYVLSEMIGPFVGAFSIFLAFWALNIFFIAADYVLNQHAPFFLVLRFVLFRIPQSIPMAFPFGCLFAALLSMSRMMGDNEVTAMRTSGVPLWRFAVAPLCFGLFMFGAAYAINEYVSPWSVDQSTRTFYQIVYNTASLPIETQFFRKDPTTGNVFYVTSVAPDNKTMQGVQIFEPGRTGGFWNTTLQAKTATVEGTVLVLHDVIQTRYNADGMMTTQGPAKSVSIGLPIGETITAFEQSVNSDPWTMSSKQLGDRVKTMREQGIGGATLGGFEVNLANKLAWPFGCFVAIIISLPLAIRFGRRGRMLGAAMAIFAFIVYFLLTSATSALGRNGAMDPYFAAWLPDIIIGGLGAVLLWLEEH